MEEKKKKPGRKPGQKVGPGKDPGGRPSDYKPEYAAMVERIIRYGGFSIVKIAKIFGVCKNTIYNWMADHDEFYLAIDKGRKLFDGIQIENALVRRATGYRYNETTLEPQANGGLAITKVVRKSVAPDVAAIKHWQANMQPERWKDRQEIDFTGKKITVEFVDTNNGDTDTT